MDRAPKSKPNAAPAESKSAKSRVSEAAGPPARVRLTVASILDKLDAADNERFRNRRSTSRVRFRCEHVPVRVTHPGGSTSERFVATRDLSPSGIGFLYDSFLHVGTRVVIRLKRRLGGEDALSGKVLYCAHVAGSFHQIGMRFDQKIFAKLYADATTAGESAPVSQAVKKVNLSGRLLLIDSQAMDRALVAHHLRESELNVVAVEDVAGAAEAIRKASQPFDAVILELNPQEADAATAVATVRSAMHTGPIVLATSARIDITARKKGQSIGAANLIGKPYQQSELITALNAILQHAAIASAEAQIQSAVEQSVADVKKLNAMCQDAKMPPKDGAS